MSGNRLTGPIPPQLGSLRRLTSLSLAYNLLSANIPRELGALTALEHLSLRSNRLEGGIPRDLSLLGELRILGLCHNILTGPIPPALGNLTNLEFLNLGCGTHDTNNFAGGIPPELGALANLTSLGLAGTGVSGPIPPELSGLKKLELLDLHNNELSGEIPPELGELGNLRSLQLNRNDLTGPVPRSFLEVQGLVFLRLLGNEVCIPGTSGFVSWLLRIESHDEPTFCNAEDVAALESLYDATGGSRWTRSDGWNDGNAVAEWYGVSADSLGRVTGLDLSRNGLEGELPAMVGDLVWTTVLRIGANELSGRLPLSLMRLPLREFRYAGTDLCVPTLKAFKVWLDGIPTHDGTGVNCRPSDRGVLKLLYDDTGGPNWTNSENWLSDEPLGEWYGVSVDKEGRVTSLDLPNNDLTGTIPPALGQLGNLEVLWLADNAELAGALTEPMTALTNLQDLRADGTGLCAPTYNPKIRAWLDRIPKTQIASCKPAVAYLTQAVQVREKQDTVPLVEAEEALLRVFLVAARKTNEHIPDARARFYVDGRQVKVIEIPGKATAIPTRIDEGSLSKSANAEVPGATVLPGLEVVIDVDSVDASLGVPRRIPATGRMKVPVDSVPTFELTLIPFLYTSKPDSSIIDTVKAIADDPEGHDLLDETRTLLPVDSLDVTAHAPVEIDSESGYAVLRNTVAIRVAEKGSGYYKGMMVRFSDVGGVAYVPGWSSASRTDGRTIAHELGHNMSLRHAPCGNPARVDPNYPHKDGSIGSWGYDFATGRVVSPRTPDFMSYCWDSWWVSGYHFTKAFDHRVKDEGKKTGPFPRAPAQSLLLWGGTGPHGRPHLEPVFIVDALPTLPAAGTGDHELRGLDAVGQELFSPAVRHARDRGRRRVVLVRVRPACRSRMGRCSRKRHALRTRWLGHARSRQRRAQGHPVGSPHRTGPGHSAGPGASGSPPRSNERRHPLQPRHPGHGRMAALATRFLGRSSRMWTPPGGQA